MKEACYIAMLVQPDGSSKLLGVIYRNNAADCALLLGLDLCFDQHCRLRQTGRPHAHIPEACFGEVRCDPQKQPHGSEDRYRIGRLPGFGMIRWQPYRPGEPPAVYFEYHTLIV